MRPAAQPRRLIEMTVDSCYVAHISAALANIGCDDVSLAPVISGWGVRGYWSSEHAFANVGKKIMVRFTADAADIEPLIKSGFGILALEIIPIFATVIN